MASPRDSKRHTEAQIQAIMQSVAIDGNTPAETWRMAGRGELGVPAFHVDQRYIYQLIKRHRDAFESQNPEALARTTYADLALAHKLNLRALEALATPEADPTERSRVAKAVAESAKALNSATKPAPKAKPHAQTNTTAADNTVNTPNVLDGLLKTTRQGAGTGSVSRARNA
jgi:hypothetical protein